VKDLSESDVSSIAFSGGEPLLRQDFFKVASYAKDCGMYVSVATNGTLITREVAMMLSKTMHRRTVEPMPPPELAYVIGVVLGDGYVVSLDYSKRIGLHAKDEEFVREFARCLAKILQRPVKVRFWKTRGLFMAGACSAALYRLLRKPVHLERLRPYVEHCDDCLASFLGGFFDSEGTVSKAGLISIANTDLEMLRYVRRLLGRLGIEAGEPRLTAPKGTPTYFPRMKKTYKKRRDCFVMWIRRHCNPTYHLRIGFTIKRKRRRLEKYLEKGLDHNPLPQPSPIALPGLLKNFIRKTIWTGRDSNPRPL